MPLPHEIKSFTPPVLHTGKDWYIDFYAFSPAHDAMKRKKIKLNFISSIKDRRKYAKDLMLRLSEQLFAGWNPWIEMQHGNSYLTFAEIGEKYRNWIDKMYQDDVYREDTMKSYKSYRNILIN